MYRVRSTDVWFNAPGVVAAYQPVAAPDAFAARRNVAHGGARFGVYTATLGVAPTWEFAAGWNFDGTQYFRTGISPMPNLSVFVRFSEKVSNSTGALSGSYGSTGFLLLPRSSYGKRGYQDYGTLLEKSGEIINGNMGISGLTAYLNGRGDGTLAAGSPDSRYLLFIGAANVFTGALYLLRAKIQCAIYLYRNLASSEIDLIYRQMKYCEQNPDWNAWSRRRRYYYAPSAAFQAAWAARQNRLIVEVLADV